MPPTPSIADGDLANAFEATLRRDILDLWFPACVDPAGGFFQNFDPAWTLQDDGERFLVFQARMTWLAATLAADGDVTFLPHAMHGLRFLADRMFDPEDEIFHGSIDAAGKPTGPYREQVHAYALSFAIYALAAVARASGSDEALQLAILTFDFLEAGHHDPTYDGYFECTSRFGKPLRRAPDGAPAVDEIGTTYGLKSQNTHLHLLEAFTELYAVWPVPKLKARIEEVHGILFDRLYLKEGWIQIYADRDWTPMGGLASFGHDVEAAHLSLAATTAIGQKIDPKVFALVDFALDHGWDEANGGFFNLGNAVEVTDPSKVWWVAAEGLLALAVLSRVPGERQARYAEALRQQWGFIERHHLDAEHRGWFDTLAADGTVVRGAKGYRWKAAYHDGRAMIFAARALRDGTNLAAAL